MAVNLKDLKHTQPRTLFEVTLYYRKWGRVPSAEELAKVLHISKAAATMRLQRLKEKKILIYRKGGLVVDESRIATQRQTARLLLMIATRCGDDGYLPMEEVIALGKKIAGGGLDDAGVASIIEKTLKSEYLKRVPGWPDHLAPGPQTANEREYLELLAK